jgi:hypothetical protein
VISRADDGSSVSVIKFSHEPRQGSLQPLHLIHLANNCEPSISPPLVSIHMAQFHIRINCLLYSLHCSTILIIHNPPQRSNLFQNPRVSRAWRNINSEIAHPQFRDRYVRLEIARAEIRAGDGHLRDYMRGRESSWFPTPRVWSESGEPC